mgnify:CR=1 FL=1
MPDVLAVAQFIGQPLHIVVIREVIEPGIVAEALQTPHGMGDLEIVVVVVAAPQTLMQFVVGNGVEHLRVGPAAVVAVDDLAHQPELRLHLVGNAAQALMKSKSSTSAASRRMPSMSNSSTQKRMVSKW